MEGAPKFEVNKETPHGPELRRTNPKYDSIDISDELTGQIKELDLENRLSEEQKKELAEITKRYREESDAKWEKERNAG
ncbi:hypothetical protein H6781_00435 [Candidatus Nomurabacteria bacterium]|nr:hypothetical protein [Candidatus Nomurabacteria bacterium]